MRTGMQFIMTNTGWRCCEQWRPWGRTGRLYLLIKSVRVCPASKRSPHETAITHTQQHQTISWQHEAPLLLNNQTRTGIEQPPNATTCTAARSSSQQRGKARQANTHTNSRSGKSAGASSIQAYTPAVAHCVTSLTQTEPQPTSTKSRSSAPVPQPARRAAGRQPEPPLPPPGALPRALSRAKPWAPCPGFRTDLGTHADTRHAAPGWHAARLHKA